ncbi:MAG: arylsulfatase [Bacteroidota bacterium]
MKVSGFILFLLLLCGSVTGCNQDTGRDTQKPNIILILTDDQGWGDVAHNGNEGIDTPMMDLLAREGARFDRFYVSPVCAPTRASLLTGRDHLRTGVQWVTYGLENMRAEEVTLAEVLKKDSYQTGLFGKWHNGSHFPMDPEGQGFDTFFGFKTGHWNNYFDTALTCNGSPVNTEGYITDVLTDSALTFIERNRNQPFFAFIPYNAPHSPFQVPDKYFFKYKNRGLDDKNASVYGMVENIDDNIGRILNKLEELHLNEHTIVLFLTDNGPNGGDRFNGNMKGWKAKVDEGGVRVPLLIRWPGNIEPGSVVDALTAHIDILPTLAELTGVPLEDSLHLDGRSFASLLLGKEQDWPNRYLFTHQSRWDSLEQHPSSVRDNRYRAVNYGGQWELYDMLADPAQQRDIATKAPEILSTFSTAYEEWFQEVSQGLDKPRFIPLGYEEAPEVHIPAPELSFSGNIQFKGTSGWSNDWLVNWTSEEDEVMVPVQVVSDGVYEVTFEYNLSPSDAGVEVTISSSSASLNTTVTQPFVGQRISSPDRVPRGEVYEKTWAMHQAGALYLNRGEQELNIRAYRIPGKESMELKSVILRKKS